MTLESDFSGDPREPLLDRDGKVLAKVSKAFKKDLTVEGSGKLKDGRVLNFDVRTKENEVRYRISRNTYGEGVGNCILIPFHTVAVDPQKIPLGSVVKILETVNMVLPDGTRHDGLWRAEDIGSAIQGDRIDLFTGAGQNSGRVLADNGIKNLRALTVVLIAGPEKDSCVLNPPPPRD